MRRELLVPVAIGVAVVTLVAAVVLWVNRGSRLVLDVKIQKIRTQDLEENASAMVIDFRVTNPADYGYQVRKVDVTLDFGDKIAPGSVISDIDAKRFMEYYPSLSPKYNDTLKIRDKLAPKQVSDRMIAVRFEVPESMVQKRQNLVLRIEEIDGQVTEILEKPKK